MTQDTHRLLINCPDRRGIVAAVEGFIARHNGNVLEADQHTDQDHRTFFMRLEIAPEGFALNRASFPAEWEPVASSLNLGWRIHWGDRRKRMAILVSRTSHCLNDLLYRWRIGELLVDIPFVAGNHEDLRSLVEHFDLPFVHLPVTDENRAAQESEILRLVETHRVDFLVLARYMQILSPEMVCRLTERIINIHHSFLPAFAGGNPYRQAYDRGVKIIGATSHYVTEDLDAGPIIAQDTLPVGHRDSLEDLVRKGRDLERMVLSRAVRLHVEDKILLTGNRTIVIE